MAFDLDELAHLQEDVEQNALKRIDNDTYDATEDDLHFADELPGRVRSPNLDQLELFL